MYPAETYETAERARMKHPARGRWEAVPVGIRLTLSEAAEIITIGRESLRRNYAGKNPRRKLPAGFEFILEGNRTILLLRTR